MTDQIVEHRIQNILQTHLKRSIENQEIYYTHHIDVFRYDDSQMTDRKS